MGVGMISRGEVGLIVASVGVTEGFMQPALFTTVVLMVVATTMVTPPFLRAVFAGQEVPHAAAG
jgi:Kef-type K+ transport system membrane component KefB